MISRIFQQTQKPDFCCLKKLSLFCISGLLQMKLLIQQSWHYLYTVKCEVVSNSQRTLRVNVLTLSAQFQTLSFSSSLYLTQFAHCVLQFVKQTTQWGRAEPGLNVAATIHFMMRCIRRKVWIQWIQFIQAKDKDGIRRISNCQLGLAATNQYKKPEIETTREKKNKKRIPERNRVYFSKATKVTIRTPQQAPFSRKSEKHRALGCFHIPPTTIIITWTNLAVASLDVRCSFDTLEQKPGTFKHPGNEKLKAVFGFVQNGGK